MLATSAGPSGEASASRVCVPEGHLLVRRVLSVLRPRAPGSQSERRALQWLLQLSTVEGLQDPGNLSEISDVFSNYTSTWTLVVFIRFV